MSIDPFRQRILNAPVISFLAVIVITGGVTAAIAALVAGWRPLLSVVLSAAVCGFSGAAALLVERVFQQRAVDQKTRSLIGLSTGFVIRMGIPFCAVVVVDRGFPTLMQTGFVYFTGAFYLLSLGLGTWLSLKSNEMA